MRMTTALLLLLASCAGSSAPPEGRADVLVYGATPAGIAAALAAADGGHDVLLIEPHARIGGLLTNGLSHTDFRTFEALTGTFLRFMRRVQEHYGPGVDCFRGTHAEPKVNLAVLEGMLAERPAIRVLRRHPLSGVELSGGRMAAAVCGGRRFAAGVFIDASYEGDLMAAAGVPWRVGRESRAEFGEPLAPAVADAQVQGYNFRLVMTREASNRVRPPAPAGYRREDYLDLLPLLAAGRLPALFGMKPPSIYKIQTPPLPNGKVDVNDMSNGPVRLSMPELVAGWPAGDAAVRRGLYEAHVRHNVGMLHFLQNDPAVPAAAREEARTWGLCRDEFEETGHVPEQLYVREARRMRGVAVFTEKDVDALPGDARAPCRADAIATGDYGPNCHGTGHEGPRFGGRHSGEFYKASPPYSIPYGVILPREVPNLLVPVAVSASHVGFCALRLEPIWTSLGQAAGAAARLALETGVRVQDVDIRRLQALLHAAGSATIYVSDVPPGSPEFVAVQAWGALGGWHGLAPAPEKAGQRGKQIVGQYYEAFPGHAAELDRPLDEALRTRWESIAGRKIEARTRGDFLRGYFR